MSWEDCLRVLGSVGGKIELAEEAELKAATATGWGDASVQLRIAEVEYARLHRPRGDDRQTARQNTKRKEANDGQEKWEF